MALPKLERRHAIMFIAATVEAYLVLAHGSQALAFTVQAWGHGVQLGCTLSPTSPVCS